jgi:hypothetical protein
MSLSLSGCSHSYSDSLSDRESRFRRAIADAASPTVCIRPVSAGDVDGRRLLLLDPRRSLHFTLSFVLFSV